MLHRSKISIMLFILLLCFISVPMTKAFQGTKEIYSIGVIQYPISDIITVSFEDPSHFEIGGDAPIWDRTAWTGDTKLFVPETDIVHSGSQSAKVELLDPSTEHDRRIHIEHDWDPITDDLWLSAWIYIPEDFVVTSWTNIIKCVSERYYLAGEAGGTWTEGVDYEWFQICLNLRGYDEWMISEGEYKIMSILHNGWIDNDGDGVNDLSHINLIAQDSIHFGEWFHIKVHVYRHKTDGIYQFWLNGVLQWDLQGSIPEHDCYGGASCDYLQTEGIDRERMANPPEDYRTYLCSGLSLYTKIGSPPKHLYFDNVKLSTGPLEVD